jgi:acetyl-CoA carboxylase biotin carboxyl carrier protein
MFSFEELCRLIRVVAEARVAGVELERDGMRVRIDGVPAPVQHAALGTTLLPPQLLAAPLPALAPPHLGSAAGGGDGSQAQADSDDAEGVAYVTSPIVGTFYRAPNPDAEPYVKIGDHVAKGQTLCIVEAMKLMNEIEADASGQIVQILPENAQPVEFGQRLFAIRPS